MCDVCWACACAHSDQSTALLLGSIACFIISTICCKSFSHCLRFFAAAPRRFCHLHLQFWLLLARASLPFLCASRFVSRSFAARRLATAAHRKVYKLKWIRITQLHHIIVVMLMIITRPTTTAHGNSESHHTFVWGRPALVICKRNEIFFAQRARDESDSI